MSKVNTGGNAFPTGTFEYDGQSNVLPYQEKGMTLRDYFAAKAMQGLLAEDPYKRMESVAKDAYRQADAMLAERERGE